MVGKYVDLTDSYKSLNEALVHGGIANECGVEIVARRLREDRAGGAPDGVRTADGILVPMGFGPRGTEGKIAAVRYARENKRAVLRHLLRHADGGDRVRAPRVRPRAAPTRPRSIPNTPHPVIDLMPDAERAHAEGRHDAARRLSVRARRRARWRGSSTARRRSPSATGIATSSTTPTASSSSRRASCCSGLSPDGSLVEMIEIARPSLVPRLPVPPRVQVAPDRLPSALQGLHPRRAAAARDAPRQRRCCGGAQGGEAGSGRGPSRVGSVVDRRRRAARADRRALRHRVARRGAAPRRAAARRWRRAPALPLVFKSSFDKANRTSRRGLSRRRPRRRASRILAEVRRATGVPVLTDVHEREQIAAVAAVVDVLQTPAFLCRQTDFILAVAAAGKPVNLKKGQFLSPGEMAQVVEKARATGNRSAAGDRARLRASATTISSSDMRSLPVLARDRLPGGLRRDAQRAAPGRARDGVRRRARSSSPPLARAAVAAGVDAVFLEVHEDPERALSDGADERRARRPAGAPGAARRASTGPCGRLVRGPRCTPNASAAGAARPRHRGRPRSTRAARPARRAASRGRSICCSPAAGKVVVTGVGKSGHRRPEDRRDARQHRHAGVLPARRRGRPRRPRHARCAATCWSRSRTAARRGEMLRLLPVARRLGVPLIAMTGAPASTLGARRRRRRST